MTKEQLAALMDGREYTNEITKEEERLAEESGLVVIFGASDDLCELRGAIDDEVGCYEGGSLWILDGDLLPTLEEEEEDALKKHGALEAVMARRSKATKVEALWDEDGYLWWIRTDAPHVAFDIWEDDQKFCRGIVIDLKELAK